MTETIYMPVMPEGLIIPEGFQVTNVHLMVLEFLTAQIIPFEN